MDTLVTQAKNIGITIDKKQEEQFALFLKTLQEWNSKLNLTAIRETQDIVTKHFIDSLSLLRYLPKGNIRLVDIGTGAGFPGIPLKIMRPDIELLLLESVGKKCKFLQELVILLDLKSVEIANARAEEVGRHTNYRESYDVATARAVSRLGIIGEYALPLLKVGGLLLAQKDITKENPEDAQNALRLLGGVTESTESISYQEGLSERKILVIKKIEKISDEYPRTIGTPEQKPLS